MEQDCLNDKNGGISGYAIRVAATTAFEVFRYRRFLANFMQYGVCRPGWGKYARKGWCAGIILVAIIPIFVFIVTGFEHCVDGNM